jgi:hypothetical protein
MSKDCCQTPTCHESVDPPVPAHGNIAGRADWVRNFCKYPAKANERFQLTDTLLMAGHFVDWASFVVELPSGGSVPFKVGTETEPDKFLSGDMNAGMNVKGFKDLRLFITTPTPVYVTVEADINEGVLGVAMWLADVSPMGSRFGN